MCCTHIVSRSLDHRMTPSNQLCSIELPIYSHWVVFPLKWPASHSTFPYVGGTVSQTFLANPHAWPLFTRTGQNLARLFLQLSVYSSCDRVEWCRLHTTRWLFLPLGERFKIFQSTVSECPVSPVHIIQHLSCLCTRGNGCVHNPLLCMGLW